MVLRAIYQDGQLQLLEPVDLQNGQEVQLEILSPHAYRRAILGDLLEPRSPKSTEPLLDNNEVFHHLDQSIRLSQPLSEILIEERADRF